MKMTLADVQAHNAKVSGWRNWPNLHAEPVAEPQTRAEYVPYKERRKSMNGLETAYAARLELLKAAGEVDWYEFEPMRLKLADDTYYRPDFGVVVKGQLEFHECKGHMREAARVRLNVAAAKFPFPFFLIRQSKGEWTVTRA